MQPLKLREFGRPAWQLCGKATPPDGVEGRGRYEDVGPCRGEQAGREGRGGENLGVARDEACTVNNPNAQSAVFPRNAERVALDFVK
jgi:hypothetical protein